MLNNVFSDKDSFFSGSTSIMSCGWHFTVFSKKDLTNAIVCDIIQTISYEEDKQSIANVCREPAAGVSR